MTRTRGTQNYIERQRIASSSHVNLIKKLKNNEIDVFINTYKLNPADDNELLNVYIQNNINVIKNTFHERIFENEELFLNNMYDNTVELMTKKNYDYVIYLRIDLYLKVFFIENIVLDPNQIQFSHIDNNVDKNSKHHFYVCHSIIIFPKRFCDLFYNKVIYNTTHGIYNNIIDSGMDKNLIHFMVKTLHICSTDLGWNPLYIQVGRKYKLLYIDSPGIGSYYIFKDNKFF